jgi:prolyl oligopeptidase PreP (S9A serine peptidase family)
MNLRNASTHSSSIEKSQNDILLVCLRASPTRVQQKFANEQDGTKRMFFVVAGRRAKVLK